MRFGSIIDSTLDLPMLPIILTEDSKRGWVRILGVIVYIPWFFIGVLIWITITAILAIPALIQDAVNKND